MSGSRSTRAATQRARAHAPGPASQPQSSKNDRGSATREHDGEHGERAALEQRGAPGDGPSMAAHHGTRRAAHYDQRGAGG